VFIHNNCFERTVIKWQFQKKLENGSFPLRFYENCGWPLAPRFHIAVPRRRRRSLIRFGLKLGYVPGAALQQQHQQKQINPRNMCKQVM
jgi:hypothetical protein